MTKKKIKKHKGHRLKLKGMKKKRKTIRLIKEIPICKTKLSYTRLKIIMWMACQQVWPKAPRRGSTLGELVSS
jgi:hypothetical protein